MATSRDAAVSAQIPIMRPGDPVVDCVAHFLSGGDRGTAFLFARDLPSAEDPAAAFRSDFKYSSLCSPEALQIAEQHGIAQLVQQLMSEFLAPVVVSAWTGPDGTRIPDSPLLAGYDSRRGDQQLSTEPQFARALLRRFDWPEMCQRVATHVTGASSDWVEVVAWWSGINSIRKEVEVRLTADSLRGGIAAEQVGPILDTIIAGITHEFAWIGAGAIVFASMRQHKELL
jgi:hypothetical protein